MNQPPTDLRRGLTLATLTACISGLAIYLNASGVRAVPDAALYTTAKNVVAALVLIAGATLLPGRLTWPRPVSRASAGLVAIAVIGGSVPFVLFFSGLAIASAPTAAFIQKTLFIWVALLAVPLLGERLGLIQVGALGVLLAGQVLVAPPNGVRIGTGEVMIAAATALWSVEVILARRLLAVVPVRTLAVARMAGGSLVLVGYLAVSGRLALVGSVTPAGWAWIVLTGAILAAYVGTWFTALRDAPASIVTSVLVLGAVVTGALSAASGPAPSATVVAGDVLIVGAIAAIGFVANGVRMGQERRARVHG